MYKRRLIILKCSAFMLLVIFLQKTGGGLLLHNFGHVSEGKESPQRPDQNNNNNTVNFACSCIDEFLAPVTPTAILVLQAPFEAKGIPIWHLYEKTHSREINYSFLRGPPTDPV